MDRYIEMTNDKSKKSYFLYDNDKKVLGKGYSGNEEHIAFSEAKTYAENNSPCILNIYDMTGSMIFNKYYE